MMEHKPNGETDYKYYSQSDEEAIHELLNNIGKIGLADILTNKTTEQPGKGARVQLRLISAIKARDPKFLDMIRKIFYQDLDDEEV